MILKVRDRTRENYTLSKNVRKLLNWPLKLATKPPPNGWISILIPYTPGSVRIKTAETNCRLSSRKKVLKVSPQKMMPSERHCGKRSRKLRSSRRHSVFS